MSMTTDAQAPTFRARVRAAADRLEELDEAARIAREQRDLLIVEACESGASTRDVARWAKVSQARIGAILAAH